MIPLIPARQWKPTVAPKALGLAKERTTLEVVDDMASWRKENHALGLNQRQKIRWLLTKIGFPIT